MPGRFALIAVNAWLTVALGSSCSSPPLEPSFGDDGWQSTPTASAAGDRRGDVHPKAIPVERRQRWSKADEIKRWSAVGERGPSEHLGGGTERTVRTNPLAAAAYAQLGGPAAMPVGAWLVQLQHEPGSDQVVAGFAMHKLPTGSNPAQGDWSYLVLDPQLRVEAEGAMPLCARCHLTAPNDSLFGPPRPATSNDQ